MKKLFIAITLALSMTSIANAFCVSSMYSPFLLKMKGLPVEEIVENADDTITFRDVRIIKLGQAKISEK